MKHILPLFIALLLVPVDVRTVEGEVRIRTSDPRYARPGSDEAQTFTRFGH